MVIRSLNPNEFVAETVDSYVAVSTGGAFIEEWEVCIEAAAISIVVNDDVFTGGKCGGVEVLNSDAVVGWFVPCVKSWLGGGHCYASVVSEFKHAHSSLKQGTRLRRSKGMDVSHPHLQ